MILIAVVCLVMLLTTLYVLATHYHAPNAKILEFIVISMCACILLIHSSRSKKLSVSHEKFVNTPQSISNTNEDISSITSGLTVYYSAFNKDSYDTTNGNKGDIRKWYNVSPFLSEAERTSCLLSRYNESHMMFDETPTYSRQDGFALGSNSITGPMSYTLGMQQRTQYTMFMFVKFTSITPSSSDIDIVQLFGNTENLNAIRFYIRGNNVDARANSAHVNMFFEFGSNTQFQCRQYLGSGIVEIQYGKPYLIIMVNNNSNIKVSMYDSEVSNKVELVNESGSANMFNIMFSNKNMVINKNKNFNGNIFAFGIYNRILTDNDKINLQRHLYSQFEITDPRTIERERVIESLRSDIGKMQACPFDESTCSSCRSVTDWTDISAVFASQNPACLTAIQKYCSENPSHAKCQCWNSNSAIYSSTSCTNFRKIFEGKACVDIDTLDRTDLSRIKSKYNLCSCREESLGLSPLKIPELAKFQIPTNIMDGLVTSNSCPSNGSGERTTNDTMRTNDRNNDGQVLQKYMDMLGNNASNVMNYYKMTGVKPSLPRKRNKIPDYFADLTSKKKEDNKKNFDIENVINWNDVEK